MELSIKDNLKSIAKITLTTLPFVIVLFFFFPRIEPLWSTSGKPQPKTGLSDEMTPNSMSDLVQDGGMAFRVQFANGRIPKSQNLYWRGPVLINYDGKTWRRIAQNRPVHKIHIKADSKITYNIIHDGSTRNWIVPLDVPGKKPQGTSINSHLELQSTDDISKPTAFSLISYSNYQTGKLTEIERRENTFLPAKIFPRARKFAQQIRAKSRDNADFTHRIWQHFRDNEFFYDLSPPKGNANIDTFLFDNRIGYCQHYASTFVFLLRSQGIPARVVTGYQGGELNNVSGEFEVRQLHAHGWAEVYLDGKGWTRYDPTAAVSPDRINNGSPFGAAENTDTIAAGARWENNSEFMRKLGTSLRAMNSFWQNWILNYDASKQSSLWQKLGLGNYRYVAWIIILIALGPLMMLTWWLYGKYRANRYGDDIYRTMQPFLRYLSRHDLKVSASQTLNDWLTLNQARLGESRDLAENVINQYYLLRYHNDTMAENQTNKINSLKVAIDAFIKMHQNKK